MKKENIIGILIYLLVFAVAIVYGFTVLQTHFQHSAIKEVWQYAIYIIVSVLGGVLMTGILQEFGHFLGAKTGGYRIVSFNLFYLTIYLNKDKYRFKFSSYDGLTGETKIVPNYKKKENPNPYPFLLYGTIFNLAWVVVCMFLFFTYYKNNGIESDLAYFFLTMGIIAALATIYNIVPTKLDSITDGYRLTQIKKDVESFNNLLAASYGGDVVEANESSKKEEVEKPKKFIPEVALSEVAPLLVEEKYDEAFDKLNKVLENENNLSNRVLVEAKAQLLYASIFSKEEKEVKELYEGLSFQLKKEISNEYTMPVIRSYILMAGLLDGSQSEVMLSLSKVVKAYKNVQPNRKHEELVLFNRALDKVIEAHPKWEEVPNYKLYE